MLQYAKVLLLLSAAFCLIALGVFFTEASKAARGAQALVKSSTDLVVETQRRVKDTSQNLNAILLQVGIVASRLQEASEAQKQVSKKTLDILNHADNLLTQTAADETTITAHSVQTLDAVQPALVDLDKSIQGLNHIINDEHITQTLANLQKTSDQVAITATNVAKTTDHVEKVADHYEKEVMKPVSLGKRIFGYVVIGLKALTIFK